MIVTKALVWRSVGGIEEGAITAHVLVFCLFLWSDIVISLSSCFPGTFWLPCITGYANILQSSSPFSNSVVT